MRVRLQAGLPLLALLAAPAARGQGASARGWLDKNVFKHVEVSGRRVLGMQFQQVSGDQEAYGSLTNYGQGLNRFTDQGNMNLTGRSVLGFLDFSVSLSDNRFDDPQNEQYTLRYNRNGVDLAYGTIQGSLLNTNPLVSFSRSLEGTVGGYTLGRSNFRFVRSQSRGDARTVTIEGNNSPGPYYLQSGRIVNDSLKVLVDGQIQKLGEDFNLDAELGSITFVDRSVPPTSAIIVTYEAFGVGQARGSIEGAGAQYDLGKWGKIGYSTVRQTAPSSNGTTLRREAFQGYGDPSIPYYLQFVPLAGTTEVRVDGMLQVPGVAGVAGGDYAFDPANPLVFYFRRFIPTSQTILVTYRPRPTASGGGDRSVSGLDMRIPLAGARRFDRRPAARMAMNRGPVGFVPRGLGILLSPAQNYGDDSSGAGGSYIQAYTATGSSSEGLGGTARGMLGQYDYKGYVIKGAVRDVPSGFVSVEGTGFNRNERATDVSISKRFGSLAARVESTNSLVSVLSTLGTTTLPTRVTSTGATLSYDGGTTGGGSARGSRWTLSHRRDRSDRNLSGVRTETSLDTTSLSTGRRAGRFGFTAGLDRQTGYGATTLDGALKMGAVGIDSVRSNVDYFLGRGLTMTGRASLSRVTAGGKSGSGTDTSATLSLAPTGNWQATATYARSDSGALSTLGGFSDGFSAGYSGSGFSGTTTAPNAIGGSNVNLLATNVTYRAGERFSLSGRFYDQSSQGSVTSNASTRALGVAGTYDLHGGNLFNVSLDRSLTSFFATGAESASSTTLDFFLSGSPQGPWTYRFGLNTLVSSGGTYAQSSTGFDASLSHRIDDRQRLTLAGNFGRVRGYYPQDDASLALLYDYRLFGNVALTSAYRWRDMTNLDSTIAAGAFRSAGFSVELSFDFSR